MTTTEAAGAATSEAPSSTDAPTRPTHHDHAAACTATTSRRTSTSSGCAGSRARSAGCSGWWTRTSTASTYSPRSRPRTKALQSFALQLLEEHLRHCVADAAVKGGEEVDAKVEEATKAIARLLRT